MLCQFFLLFWISHNSWANDESVLPPPTPEKEALRPIKLEIGELTKLINIPFGEYLLSDKKGPSEHDTCPASPKIYLELGPDSIDLWVGGTPMATNLERTIYRLEDDYGDRCQTTLYTSLHNGLITQRAVRNCQGKEVIEEFKLERLGESLVKLTYRDVTCFYTYSGPKKKTKK